MKNTLKYISLLLVVLGSLAFTLTNNHFEGKVVYNLSYADLPAEIEPYKAMLPSSTTIHIKGHLSRMEQSGMGVKNVVLEDATTNSKTLVMDYMGDKIWADISEKKETPTITYLEGTKEISGYKCKKAQLTFTNTNRNTLVYYTEELPKQSSVLFANLKGFPMEYKITAGRFKATITAATINQNTVNDSQFKIPEGYRKVSQEELKKLYSSGMGN